MTGPLEDLRVLEWCGGSAGAACGKILSDLGATVIKLEPPDGDPSRRQLIQRSDGHSGGRFLYLNTGKQSVVADGSSSSRAKVRRLLSEADVLLTDEEADVADVESGAVAPSLIWCALSPFGATGPYSGFKGHHLTVFHSGGEGHLLPSGLGWELFPERPPLQLGSGVGHYDTGANSAVAILAAVFRQRDTGQGERIDISGQESQLTLNRTRLSRYNNDGIELRRDRSRYGAGGMLTCADGRVQLVGMRKEHWAALKGSVEGALLHADVERHLHEGADQGEAELAALVDWCATRPKSEVVRALSEAGCPIGAYATPADLLADAQLHHRRFFQTVGEKGGDSITLPGVPYRFSATPITLRPAPHLGEGSGYGPRDLRPPTEVHQPRSRPLEGLRVVDFTWAAAGPYATLLLALLGAEVIKIESSRRPDPARRGFMADYGGTNSSPNFNELNLNKRCFQVNLTQPAGLELVQQLIAVSDVVVDNLRPGVMTRYGLDAASLLAQHPSLIVASSSANGASGPDAKGAGLASIFGATGGLSAQTGYPDGPPTEVGESTDYRSANALAVAVLAALVHRQRTGIGQAIDLSSREVVIASSPDALLAHALGLPERPRLGNHHDEMSPHDLYACRGNDEWIAIAVGTEEEWSVLCRLLGRPDWPGTYASAQERSAAADIIDAALSAWTGALTTTEAFARLQEVGIASAPCFTNAQLVADAHIRARGVFVEVAHPIIGTLKVMRAPWLMTQSASTVNQHGPLLGQDNRYVLEELLGTVTPPGGWPSGVFD